MYVKIKVLLKMMIKALVSGGGDIQSYPSMSQEKDASLSDIIFLDYLFNHAKYKYDTSEFNGYKLVLWH